MNRYWVSWWSTNSLNAGCTKPPFHFWETGQRTFYGHLPEYSFCAVVGAEDNVAAVTLVQHHFPDKSLRFCDAKPADWSPSGHRFPCPKS